MVGTAMNDEINEQLSALMDGELSAEEIDAVLQAIKAEGQARSQWASYHLIRDSLQGHLPEIALRDIAREISQALEQEPTLLVAAPAETEEVVQRPPQQWRYATGLALAASLSAVTVLGVQALTGRVITSDPAVAIVKSPTSPGTETPVLDSQHWAVLEPEVKERLNIYLVNHTEYVDNMPGMLRYGRIVSYESSR
jgi:sigma-E factor negative regulatory protein RseA